jgi:CheY-like chemotaxis protein
MSTREHNQILIVEDDDANREFLRVLLEAEDFAVVTARDGQEACEAVGAAGVATSPDSGEDKDR